MLHPGRLDVMEMALLWWADGDQVVEGGGVVVWWWSGRRCVAVAAPYLSPTGGARHMAITSP